MVGTWKRLKVELIAITAKGDKNYLYGDAGRLESSQGVADTLTAIGDENHLYGDASVLSNSHGGADTITATGD